MTRMSTNHDATPERQRDPVCGMNVRLDAAIADGLLTEHDGHTYYFCRAGCLEEFTVDPDRFTAAHGHAAADPAPAGTPVIDDGMRRWYESCSCCLSDAYPEVKAALDAERTADQPAVSPGICEVAEAAETPAPADR